MEVRRDSRRKRRGEGGFSEERQELVDWGFSIIPVLALLHPSFTTQDHKLDAGDNSSLKPKFPATLDFERLDVNTAAKGSRSHR